MNGNERYILEGIIIVLAAAYIFYENVLMSFILSPYVYIHYRQRIKERIVHDKKNFKKKFKDGIMAGSCQYLGDGFPEGQHARWL